MTQAITRTSNRSSPAGGLYIEGSGHGFLKKAAINNFREMKDEINKMDTNLEHVSSVGVHKKKKKKSQAQFLELKNKITKLKSGVGGFSHFIPKC